MNRAWDSLQRKIVHSGHTIGLTDNGTGEHTRRNLYDQLNRVSGMSNYSIHGDYQTNLNGLPMLGPDGEKALSLDKIMDMVAPEKRQEAFDYLHHWHNLDRVYAVDWKDVRRALKDPGFRAYLKENQIDTRAFRDDPLQAVVAWATYQETLPEEIRQEGIHVGKPIWGKWNGKNLDTVIDAEESLRRIVEYDKNNPEFYEFARHFWNYNINNLKLQVQAGLLSAEDAARVVAMYPHWVSTKRADKDGFESGGGGSLTSSTLRTATGGRLDSAILPPDAMSAAQTRTIYRNAYINMLGQSLVDSVLNGDAETLKHVRIDDEASLRDALVTDKYGLTEAELMGEDAAEEQDVAEGFDDYMDRLAEGEPPIGFTQTPRGGTLTVKRNGKSIKLLLDSGVTEGINAIVSSPSFGQSNPAWKAMQGATTALKRLSTSYNPAFAITNPLRDIQGTAFFSQDPVALMKNLPRALSEMADNGAVWQLYNAMGIPSSSFVGSITGETTLGKVKSGTKAVPDAVETVNMIFEQAPRFAEFISVLEATGDVLAAAHAAADVTVNFGRSGTVGRVINQVVPFFNAGVQDLDKMRRVAVEAGVGKWARLIALGAAMGIGPQIIGELLYGDDDDYKELPLRDKANFYLFRKKDGKFIKVPKSRIQASIGGFAQAGIDAAKGEKPEWGQAIKVVGENLAPANPFDANILTTTRRARLFDDDEPGKTWWGGNIENTRDGDKKAGQRYDERTSVIFRELGKATNLSPKKLQDIFDSMTGFAGDIIIPATAPAGGRSWLESKFEIDPVYSSTNSTRFYDVKKEYKKAQTDEDASPRQRQQSKVVSHFLNKQSSEISELYDKISEIQNSDKDKKTKAAESRDLRKQINDVAKGANDVVEDYDDAVERLYSKALTNVNGDKDKLGGELYFLANREVFGAEYALQKYNKEIYKKAQGLHNSTGLSYDAICDFYQEKTKNRRAYGKDGSETTESEQKTLRWLMDQSTKKYTNDQKTALAKTFLPGGKFIPEDREIDFTNNDTFIVTQMSDAAQKAWKRLEERAPELMSGEQFRDLYKIVSGVGKKKDEKISEIRTYTGWSQRDAEWFWNLVREKEEK